MGKRDELMKLKAQRVHKPIQEMETPVEDIPIITEIESDAENKKVDIEENSSKIIENVSINEELEDKKNNVVQNIVQKKNNQSKGVSLNETMSIESISQLEDKKTFEHPESKKEDQSKKETFLINEPDTNEKEATKRTSMALKIENNQFLRLRAMQLGMSMQYYINLLIEEEKIRNDIKSLDVIEIQENIEMNYRRGEKTTIVALVLKEKNAKYLKRGGAIVGMNATSFLNYIISEEIIRETNEGKRPSEFDD